MEEFVTNYNRAVELLKAVPGTKQLFELGVPLCPVLIPRLKPLKVDNITLDKVGGLPDLRHNWLYNYDKRIKAYNKATGHKQKVDSSKYTAERLWPRCGTCHNYMSFVGQFDLTDTWEAIHRLTCTGDKYGHFSYSSVGLAEDSMRNLFWRESVEWTFWACANTCEHFYSQQFDACVWTEKHPIYDEEMQHVPKESDLELAAKSVAEATEVAKDFYDKHKIKNLVKKKQQIVGMDMYFDLDFGVKPWSVVSYKLEQLLEKVQNDNPDIFAYSHNRQFKLFGEPESQQEEARFFGLGNRCSEPYRLSPVLCWDDDEQDMTYQMYADVQRFDGEGRRNMFAKIDSSCT